MSSTSSALRAALLDAKSLINLRDAQWRNNVEYFFAACVALGCLSYIFAETRARFNRRAGSKLTLQAPINLWKRLSLLSFKVPVVNSRVYASILMLWLLVCGFLTASFLVQTQGRNLRLIAARSGQVAAAMYPPLFVLSMKNSPVGLLVGSSHEKLNILHRWTGKTLACTVLVHMLTYIVEAARKDNLHSLTTPANIYGMAAFGTMLLLAVSSISMARRRNYEVFYVLHWIFAILTLAFTYMHFKDCMIYVLASIVIIATDLVLRIGRVLLAVPYAQAELANINEDLVTVTVPLPRFGPMRNWTPGSHAFINVPSLTGAHQHHPFTISSIPEDGHIRFVIKKQRGFTSSLHKREVGPVRCLIDGPYGSMEKTRFAQYPHVLLIGGGVGITFVLPILKALLKRSNGVQSIAFIWSTHNASTFSHFERELRELQMEHEASSSDIALRITVAFTSGKSPCSSQRPSISASTMTTLKDMSHAPAMFQFDDFFKKASMTRDKRTSAFDVTLTRVSLANAIQAELRDTNRLAIGACGPNRLVKDVKKATAVELGKEAKDIFLYTEEFEW